MMLHSPRLALLLLALAAPAADAQYQLVWQDEFEGTAVDPAKWQFQFGTGCPSLCGWGNNELQFYRSQNASVSGGMLTITAREESFAGSQYTSARLRTKGLASWRYGRFEMRARLPIGQGLWPAFWMLPEDDAYGVWAASGEIDIMEYVGQDPDRVFGTIHYGDTFPGNVFSGGGYTLPAGTFHDGFHVFAVEWEPTEIRWYVDGILYSTKTDWWSSGGPYPAPFDQDFHLLLNVAVGGNLPGSPDPTTQFPQQMVVDWVRVYQEVPGGPVCSPVFDDMEHAFPQGNGYFTFPGGGTGGISGNLSDVPPGVGEFASLEASWSSGGNAGFLGGFGRTAPLDTPQATHFELWLNPDAGQEYVIEINLQDDDNGDDTVPGVPDGADDEFQYALTVGGPGSEVLAGGGWQHVVLPLTSFVDDDSYHFGGNGVLDLVPTGSGGNGRLVNVVLALISSSGSDVDFRTDLWRLTRRTASVQGKVWNDLNGDGLDSGEPGLGGVLVELVDAATGEVLADDATSAGGQYQLAGLPEGDYVVRIDPSTLPAGAVPTFDPDGTGTPLEFALDLACNESLLFQDLGFELDGVARYCSGEPNSAGPGSTITADGGLSISAASFVLQQNGGVPGQFGVFYFGPSAIDVPFGEGRRCVGGQVYRFLPATPANGAGASSRAVDFGTLPGNVIAPGSTWNFQYWYRDPLGGPSGFNLSDAISVTFLP